MNNTMNSIRLRKAKLNLATSILYQAVVLAGGFLVPRFILVEYGSIVNGLLNSISQFLNVFAFMDMGVGMVVASALFGPLARNDYENVSAIVSSSDKFYRKVGVGLLFYIALLGIFYPRYIATEFDSGFTISILLILSVELILQYFLGITDLYLLTAMQESYIQFIVQTIVYVISVAVACILISNHFSILTVKAATALFFFFKPIVIRLYVKKRIKLNRFQKYDKEPIEQKWYGFAQHISFVILQNTDSVILSIFQNIGLVSVYSVYNMIVMGVKALITTAVSSIMPTFGDLLARKEYDEARKFFDYSEWLIHNVIVFAFGCTSVLLLPFVMIYTRGIEDVNYRQPLFAFVITIANAAHCMRVPYNNLIKAAGHYKETRWSYYVSAAINVIVSVLLVEKYGLIGVSLGTLLSMAVHTCWLVFYQSYNLINRPVTAFFKQFIYDFIVFFISYNISRLFSFSPSSYFEWIKLAVRIALVWGSVLVISSGVAYKRNLLNFLKIDKEMHI